MRQKIRQMRIMPQYFFHLQNGTNTVRDTEGVELESLDEVCKEAKQSAREIMSEQILRGEAPKDSAFSVVDAHGRTVLTYPFKRALDD